MTHPAAEPFDAGMLDAGDGHAVYWEVCGRPDGRPAVVLHGGPGSGATPCWRRFFDPDRYRVLLFDQRGCGRSTPHAGDDLAALRHNTTRHLIADIERLREYHGIDTWLVFGGSWGSTLGLAYAVTHPERVSDIVLWAVTTTGAYEVEWLTRTMGLVYPQEYATLLAALPEAARDGDVPAAFNRLLRSPDPAVHHGAARAWCAWEDRLATVHGPVQPSPRFQDPRFRLGFARLVTHYFAHHGFLPDDGILGQLHRIAHIPAYLLCGGRDIAAPLSAAVAVADRLPLATLRIVASEGHAPGPESARLLAGVLDAAVR